MDNYFFYGGWGSGGLRISKLQFLHSKSYWKNNCARGNMAKKSKASAFCKPGLEKKKYCTKAITYQNKKQIMQNLKREKNTSRPRKLPHHHPTEMLPYLVFLPVWVSQTCAWCEAGLGEDQTYRFLSAESETKFMRIESSQWFKLQQSLQTTNKALNSAETSSNHRETKRRKTCR